MRGICKVSWPAYPWCLGVDRSAGGKFVAFLSEVPQQMVCTGGCPQITAAVCNLRTSFDIKVQSTPFLWVTFRLPMLGHVFT